MTFLAKFVSRLTAGKADGLWRRFFNLFAWISLATLFDRAATLAAVFLAARLVDGESFGRWGVAQSTVTALLVFVNFGGAVLIGRYVPQFKQSAPERAAETIRVALLISAIVIALACIALFSGSDLLAAGLFKAEPSFWYAALIAGWLSVVGVGANLAAAAAAFEDGKAVAWSSLGCGAVALALIPLGAHVGGAAGMMVGVVVAELVRAGVLTGAVNRSLAGHGQILFGPIQKETWVRVRRFAGPVFLQAALYSPVLWLGQIILMQKHADPLIEAAAFAYGLLFFGLALMVTSRINQAGLPIMSSLTAPEEARRLMRFSQQAALVNAATATAMAIPIALAAPWLTPPSLTGHWAPIAILAVAGVVVSTQTSLANALLVVDRQLTVLGSIIPWAGIFLGLIWVYVDSAGANAMAGAFLAAGVVRTLILFLAWMHLRNNVWNDLGAAK